MITQEKYDATERATESFEKNFNILSMMFNKMSAFKTAVSDIHPAREEHLVVSNISPGATPSLS